jgi:hypothetical protein
VHRYKPMILDNSKIIADFSKHFNCRLTSLDFIENVGELLSLLNNKSETTKKSTIILPCGNKETFNQLVKFNYSKLLNEICQRIILNEELLDIYKSEMQKELVQFYNDYLKQNSKLVEININHHKNLFEITSQDLFVNLTISAFSQFHTELIGQIVFFNKIIEINSTTSDSNKQTDNLYINSKVSTAFSYFIIAYLAENMNIKLKL